MNRLIVLLILEVFMVNVWAATPELGAQIWIEPGQTQSDIDTWFRQLADHNMTHTRLFMMWNFIETEPGEFDFTLYDWAFEAAARHNIGIVATLTTNHGPAFYDREFWFKTQGGGVSRTRQEMEYAANYVEALVQHYQEHPALDTWMLMNEPGMGAENNPLAIAEFRGWLKEKYGRIENLNPAWITDYDSFAAINYAPEWDEEGFGFATPIAFIDWHTFWHHHLTDHLNWIADQIRRFDKTTPIHVNPHALVSNIAGIHADLPAWRPFLSSLGASIHPSWHFGLLGRDQFALGVSYVCDLIHGSSEPNPFWVTELQGGNNLYSSVRPLCPTPEDIAQWVWTGIGAGAERVIFWLLNFRRQGGEAGEWSLLNLDGEPSERLETAGEIAAVLKSEPALANARARRVPITLLLSQESLIVNMRYSPDDHPGRSSQAHIYAVLGYYQALSQLGFSPKIKFMHDFLGEDAPEEMVIVPHALALPDEHIERINQFVRRGGTALVTGLSGFYDETTDTRPLQDTATRFGEGVKIREIRRLEKDCVVELESPQLTLPSQLWVGDLQAPTEPAIAKDGERITGIRQSLGQGELIWIPSPVGLQAWVGDSAPLAAFLRDAAKTHLAKEPIRFAEPSPGVVMRVLEHADGLVTVITNGTLEEKQVQLESELEPKKAIWGTTAAKAFTLGPRQTVVMNWK